MSIVSHCQLCRKQTAIAMRRVQKRRVQESECQELDSNAGLETVKARAIRQRLNTMAKKKKISPLKRDILIDALVWNCPLYSRDGIASCCVSLIDGSRSNCVKERCSRVFDIFKTMAQIENKEIIVW